MSKLNTKLLARVANHIYSHPDRFDMSDWIYNEEGNSIDEELLACTVDDLSKEDYCGTVACIAGWTLLLGLDREGKRDLESGSETYDTVAHQLLGKRMLTKRNRSRYARRYRLFYTEDWPERLYYLYRDEEIDKRQEARIAIAAIAAFCTEEEWAEVLPLLNFNPDEMGVEVIVGEAYAEVA